MGQSTHDSAFAIRVESHAGELMARAIVTPGERVLHAFVRAGERAIPVGCRGGGCGACRVVVLSGDYDTLVMSRAHVSVEEQALGVALACRVLPHSDLVVRLAPRLNVLPI